MLTDLLLRDFRCFQECRVALHPETTVFIGRNAQGKTSIMEAACVLLRLQSPRTGNRPEMIRLGATTMLIEGGLGEKRLRCAQSATVRRLALDGTVCTRSAEYLAASDLVVWMDLDTLDESDQLAGHASGLGRRDRGRHHHHALKGWAKLVVNEGLVVLKRLCVLALAAGE